MSDESSHPAADVRSLVAVERFGVVHHAIGAAAAAAFHDGLHQRMPGDPLEMRAEQCHQCTVEPVARMIERLHFEPYAIAARLAEKSHDA